MAKIAAERISALAGHCTPGKSGVLGADGTAGVVLRDMQGLVLHQAAGWSDSMDRVGTAIAKAARVETAPGPGRSATGERASLLRIEPMKWWLVGVAAPKISPNHGTVLDLSHSRTRIRVSGAQAAVFLNRFLPLDLRERSFPVDSVASSAIHHVGVTLWRSGDGYDLFVPRGFALFVWEGLIDVARQFGLEIV